MRPRWIQPSINSAFSKLKTVLIDGHLKRINVTYKRIRPLIPSQFLRAYSPLIVALLLGLGPNPSFHASFIFGQNRGCGGKTWIFAQLLLLPSSPIPPSPMFTFQFLLWPIPPPFRHFIYPKYPFLLSLKKSIYPSISLPKKFPRNLQIIPQKMLSLEFVGLILLFAIIPFGQNEDLNATNGTLAINGPPAVEQATSSSLPPSVPAGPLERLGEFAKSLSPFPLNASAPAPPMDGNFTSTSPGANGANEMATNATGAFTPYNVTISPLEMPPTASTNLPPAVPVADPIDGGQSPLPLVNTTTSTTTTSQPPQPPPQPASASTFNNNLWASMAFGTVFLMFLIGSMMI